MRAKHIALVALAASLLLVGAAGAATAQPVNDSEAANETAPDEPGPPEDTPDGPPAFVSDILSTVNDFLSGEVEDLGSAISDLTPGDDGADGGEGNETAEDRPDVDDERADR